MKSNESFAADDLSKLKFSSSNEGEITFQKCLRCKLNDFLFIHVCCQPCKLEVCLFKMVPVHISLIEEDELKLILHKNITWLVGVSWPWPQVLQTRSRTLAGKVQSLCLIHIFYSWKTWEVVTSHKACFWPRGVSWTWQKVN